MRDISESERRRLLRYAQRTASFRARRRRENCTIALWVLVYSIVLLLSAWCWS